LTNPCALAMQQGGGDAQSHHRCSTEIGEWRTQANRQAIGLAAGLAFVAGLLVSRR
jgi:ElaB/YqjD/DUF883 family membrane-anchored ribosome-binding protein